MAQDPKKQPGDHARPDSDRDAPADATQFPVGGAVLSGTREDADDPMSEAQVAELRQLCDEKDEVFDTSLTRAQADARIEALKSQ